MYPRNFFNPMYPNMMGVRAPIQGMARGGGLLSKLGLARRGINLSTIITNTGKTLNVVNQAIPVIKQTGPMINNMKTMFKLASAFKDTTDEKKTSYNETSSKSVNRSSSKTDIKDSIVKQEDNISASNSINKPNFFLN